jgi:hypothetical protein
MALPAPIDRTILHFTHLSNLPIVLDRGSLLADAIVGTHLKCEVGDRGIKANRRELAVTHGPGGHPCDYVPFYFAPRSPMLYKIAVGGVPHYQDGQDPLVYLCTTIGTVVRAGRPWVFSNGNCGAHLTEYSDDLGQLDSMVDWPLQSETIWRSTAEDPTRATRRAAEFLVHERLPWAHVNHLVVRTPAMAEAVKEILARTSQRQAVFVRPDWYYQGSKYR